MAGGQSLFARALILHTVFLAALLLRILADAHGFPVDGSLPAELPLVAEHFVFYCVLYAGMLLLLQWAGVPIRRAGHTALSVMLVYMYVHFLAYWFPAGGRMADYASVDHLWLNISTAFLGSGDAGFWQVMRIFSAGSLLMIVLVSSRARLLRSVVGMLALYLWGMLASHAGDLVWMPLNHDALSLTEVQSGLFNAVMALHFTLALWAVGVMLSRQTPDKPHGPRAGWLRRGFVFLLPLIVVAPLIAPTGVYAITALEAFAVLLASTGLVLVLGQSASVELRTNPDAVFILSLSGVVFLVLLLWLHAMGIFLASVLVILAAVDSKPRWKMMANARKKASITEGTEKPCL